MMLISAAGNWRQDKGLYQTPKGFTLIELVVVLVILGVMAAMAFPTLEGIFPDGYLRSSARHLVGMIRYAQSQTALSGKEYRLYYDLDKREYWIARKREENIGERNAEGKMIRRLPEGVRFHSITTAGEGKVSGGIASSWFSPRGWVEETSIHLQNERGEELFVLIKGLTGRVRILEEDEE